MKKLFFYRLDFLRFFAFLLVFWQHSFSKSIAPLIGQANAAAYRGGIFTGGAGVHIFFVLSGFLITLLLIKENDKSGSISVFNFYIRRILRIWPLYYLIVISGMFILPHLFNTISFHGSVVKNLTFLNNFDVNAGLPGSSVGVAWSVAIEEQFYLFWPILFYFFYTRKILSALCIGLWSISTYYIVSHQDSSYFNTLGNINYLMIGCLGAMLYTRYNNSLTWLFKQKLLFFALIAITTVLQLISFRSFSLWCTNVVCAPFLYLYFVAYLTHNSDNGQPSVISQLGKYTYGMYLYHPTIILIMKIVFDRVGLDYARNPFINILHAIICLAITILLSIVSYKYFEMFFLNFKNRFAMIKTRV